MHKLNVWWLSQYAATPDQRFTTQHDLARKLVEKGHRVTFFAAGFSDYKFKEIRLNPRETWRTEEHDGVRFVWLKTSSYQLNDYKRVVNDGRRIEPIRTDVAIVAIPAAGEHAERILPNKQA
jgi:hypothetical protein